MTATAGDPVTATAGDPVPQLSNGVIAFGNVAVGSRSPSVIVTVGKSGFSNLRISGLSEDGMNPDAFLLAAPSTPFDVSPGQQAEFRVTFAPAAAGSHRTCSNS